jgi:hypothetical protein
LVLGDGEKKAYGVWRVACGVCNVSQSGGDGIVMLALHLKIKSLYKDAKIGLE